MDITRNGAERNRGTTTIVSGLSFKTTGKHSFMDRLLVGAFTLGGFYVGSRYFFENPRLGVPPLVAGNELGLLVAVMFPTRKI
ncbi:hypothetical protein H9L17_04995 [Thermomonas brevis]|uniref:Uncharacterized protein n=1 Tax=Thermomonas brevis TaxID=215691 RepID=A0A7G9QVX3_9GAMM|nr:hypothetical protein [Thermomonas brevis]QNN47498.1 hypothetical protein H9L17_04995 [Thermomonas brevis]